MHLPVPADQRSAGASRTAATALGRSGPGATPRAPGRSPSHSMKLSDAPPPVERKPTRSARPSSSRALALSPPPTTVKPSQSATAWATIRVPAAKRGSSKAPMGPFHRTVPAWPTTSAKAAAESGPMSSPVHPSGRSPSVTLTLPRGPWPSPAARRSRRAPGPGCRWAGGSRCRIRAGPGRRPGGLVEQRAPHAVAHGGQEGEGHAAADDEGVDLGGQHLEHLDLVGHLGSAHHGHEGTGRLLQQAAQHLDLLGEAQAGRAGQELGRADDGGVAAVGHPEGLVDVGIEALDEGCHEGGVVGLLARVEAQVVGQLHAGAQRRPGARAPGPSPSAGPARRPAGPGGSRPPRRPPGPAASAGWAGRP